MEYQSLDELKFTPASVTTLEKNEIFVFGSNTKGHHSGGAALFAKKNFGAIEGQAEGLQGKSYAIPTVGQSLDEIGESVDKFIEFASWHNKLGNYAKTRGDEELSEGVTYLPMRETGLSKDIIVDTGETYIWCKQ